MVLIFENLSLLTNTFRLLFYRFKMIDDIFVEFIKEEFDL